jgi:class 3 adenylate cyclase/CheY-like chemotaxis protein
VRTPPRLLVADDNPLNVDILRTRLAAHGYEILTASDGPTALALAREQQPDLLLLDIMMPGLDGLEVCRRLKADSTLPFMPIILVTAKADSRDVVAGLDAGADEYLPKPVDQAALVARVKSMLRIKALHDTVEEQAAALGEWNRTLESRVQAQVAELERLGRLKRFFSPQLADAIVQGGAEDPLRTHRRDVTVVFADLRGFTAFAEAAEPEEVMAVLREYHAEMGGLILAHEGTLERFTGDGLMVFFNDPIPVPDAPARAVRMAVAMRDRVAELAARWRKEGYELDLGLGIARGYATLGAIGFEGRWDYAALGTVTNLAARLCGEARPGQILAAHRVLAALDALVDTEPLGELPLKGFLRPVPVFNVVRLRAGGPFPAR